jgi:hypothetical protein
MEEDTALVEANALLECQELEEQYQFYLELKRENLGARDQFLGALQEKLSAENQQQDSDSFQLPTEILGTSVEWYLPQEQLHWRLFLLGIICILVSAIRQRGRREKEKKRWQQGLERDYPDIVSRLSLLVGAGMTVSAAMGKLAQEYAGSQGKRGAATRPGYEELVRTWNEIQDGIGERRAYENFGIRCGQAKYRKLASLLIQNVRKGAKGIQQLLDGEAQEAYMQQRMYVRQRGEEASTKLLLPMGIMLVLVLAILMVPAMMSMNV